MRQAKYPVYLNSPFKAGGVESDDIIIFLITFCIGLLIKPVAGIVFAFISTFVYRKVKVDKPRGFILHLPYAIGLKTFMGFDDVFHEEYGE